MLEEAGVAATPGVDFDPCMAENFLRLCYAGAREEMREAVERIGNWLKDRRVSLLDKAPGAVLRRAGFDRVLGLGAGTFHASRDDRV